MVNVDIRRFRKILSQIIGIKFHLIKDIRSKMAMDYRSYKIFNRPLLFKEINCGGGSETRNLNFRRLRFQQGILAGECVSRELTGAANVTRPARLADWGLPAKATFENFVVPAGSLPPPAPQAFSPSPCPANSAWTGRPPPHVSNATRLHLTTTLVCTAQRQALRPQSTFISPASKWKV